MKKIDPIIKSGIGSVEELEEEIAKYVDDFSVIDVHWMFDHPL
jgi:hypothetical protein